MIAVTGMITCFLPLNNHAARVLLIVCFGPGNFTLLLQMCIDKNKLRTWLKYGGIFNHLIVACSLVYILSVLISLIIWKQHILTTHATAVAALLFGVSILYLACVLRKIYHMHPEAEKLPDADITLSIEQAMLLLIGTFLVLLGILLVPVCLGLLPFAANAQLGLLMVIFAFQMLASGNTPIGPFPRSWLMIGFGLVFAALGIVSCIIPNILVPLLTILVGVLNIIGGLLTLTKILIPLIKKSSTTETPAIPILAKLFVLQVILNLLAIAFGTSMLLPSLVPGLLVGLVLAANGFVLLYLLRILVVIDAMKSAAETRS